MFQRNPNSEQTNETSTTCNQRGSLHCQPETQYSLEKLDRKFIYGSRKSRLAGSTIAIYRWNCIYQCLGNLSFRKHNHSDVA